MIALVREERRYVAGAVALAVALGATGWVSPFLPLLLVVIAAIVVGGVARPVILVPLVFAGILWSNAGLIATVKVGGVDITLGKLTMALALGVWSLHAALHERPLLVAHRLTAPMLAVLVVMIASLAWAAHVRMAFGVTEIIGLALLIVMFHWVYTVVDEATLPTVLRALGWIVAPIMAWTLWNTPDMAWWEEYERAAGVYDNANFWCAILLLVCPLLIGFFVEDDHWTSPLLLAAIAALLPLNVVASLSRAGFVGLVVITPFMGWLLWRRKWWVLAGALVVLLSAPSFLDPERVAERYRSLVDASMQEVDGSLTERRIAANAGIQLFVENPLVGVGVGMYKEAATEATGGAINVEEPHNTYVWIASEQGLLGLAVFAWFVAEIARLGWTTLRGARTAKHRALSIAFLSSMLAVASMGLTAGFMTFPTLYLVLGLGTVLGDVVARSAQAPVRSARPA